MKRTTLTNHIAAFKTETLMLLRYQLAFNRISKFDDLHSMSRSDFVDKILSLKTIENDLLIRVCKFDDYTKGVHSFKKAVLELGQTHPNKKEIEQKVKKFSTFIDIIKKKRRHRQLAHLKIGEEDNDYHPRLDFTPAIKMIVEIIDLMNPKRITYKWSDGRYEKHDLRIDVLGEDPDQSE